MHFRAFTWGQGTEWEIGFGLLKFQIFFRVPAIPNNGRCWARDEKMRVPPWAFCHRSTTSSCGALLYFFYSVSYVHFSHWQSTSLPFLTSTHMVSRNSFEIGQPLFMQHHIYLSSVVLNFLIFVNVPACAIMPLSSVRRKQIVMVHTNRTPLIL